MDDNSHALPTCLVSCLATWEDEGWRYSRSCLPVFKIGNEVTFLNPTRTVHQTGNARCDNETSGTLLNTSSKGIDDEDRHLEACTHLEVNNDPDNVWTWE